MNLQSQKKKQIKKEEGGAVVETLVLLLIMVPLFSAIPLLGKLSDINNATLQSSRYVAWERTVANGSDKTAGELSIEVNNRFFSRPDLGVQSNQLLLADSGNQNSLWLGVGKESDGSYNRLITSGLDTYVPSSQWAGTKAPSSLVGTLSSGIVQLGKTVSAATGGNWDLEEKGLFSPMISVNIGSNKWLSSGENCNEQSEAGVFSCLSHSNAIFVDSWSGSGRDPEQIEDRVRALVPAAALRDMGGTFASVIGNIPLVADLGYLENDDDGGFGYVDATVTPLDRYVTPVEK